MAKVSEVFGRCVVGIFVIVGLKNGDWWLCCGSNYLGLFWRVKWHKIGGIGGSWCQVLDGVCGGLGVIEEIKKTLWWRELEGVDGDIVYSAMCDLTTRLELNLPVLVN